MANKEKLEELAQFIEKLPSGKVKMNDWARMGDLYDENHYPEDGQVRMCEQDINVCGTACCIAGWQVIKDGLCIDDNGNVYKDKKSRTVIGDAADHAQAALELTDHERRLLFYSSNWPYIPNPEGEGWTSFESTPQDAAKRIRYLIETDR